MKKVKVVQRIVVEKFEIRQDERFTVRLNSLDNDYIRVNAKSVRRGDDSKFVVVWVTSDGLARSRGERGVWWCEWLMYWWIEMDVVDSWVIRTREANGIERTERNEQLKLKGLDQHVILDWWTSKDTEAKSVVDRNARPTLHSALHFNGDLGDLTTMGTIFRPCKNAGSFVSFYGAKNSLASSILSWPSYPRATSNLVCLSIQGRK